MNSLLSRSLIVLSSALIVLVGWVNPAFSQGFYDMNTINDIDLIFSMANWDWLLDSLQAAGSNERLAATAIINGVQYDSVGVRYKGHSSYNPNQVKNPLNIKLDWVYEDQLIEGYGTIVLSNGWHDPSFVRETLSYEIAGKYMPASLANYANVTINGQLIGLYDSVQDLDKYFCRTHYDSDDNAFFKGESQGGPTTSVVWGYQGPDTTAYANHFDLQSDYGWADLVNFLYQYNYQSANIPNVLDVDNHLWMLAFDILTVNLDGPINWANNYYIYKDATGPFNPILWDLNMNFGGFTSLLGQGFPQNLTVTQMQQLNPYLNATNNNYPIIKNVLSDTTNKRMYIAHMKTIIAENFSNNWYYTRAQQLQSIIGPTYQADPNKFYTYTQFQANLNTAQGGGMGGGTVGLTQLMTTRITYLNNLAPFTAVPPTLTNVTYSPTTIPPNTTVWFNATAIGATKVLLGYRNGHTGRFYRTQMFDDGQHNDQLAGDGIWGVSRVTGLTEMDYYVWAEDSDAGIFSPVKAEPEHYTLPVEHTVVINEILADNESTVTDPQGEYDDWIELYNGLTSALDLAGMYLTDDPTEPGQWAFPDTSIGAGGYLIVWADSDTGDAGLHANFALNNEGETVGLYLNQGGAFLEIDLVSFGLQAADISYGRYPNGTGNFVTMSPTFAAPNQQEVVSGIVINEINYNSDSTFNAMDWVELVNNTSSAVNLGGWIFKDSDDLHTFTIPTGTVLSPGGFLVLCEDTSAFATHFPSVSSYVGPFAFGLSNGGELIRLYNAALEIIDSVRYDDQLPWPTEPDGNGPTLELIDPDLPNSNPVNWQASTQPHGSPGQSNGGSVASPVEITLTPISPPIQIPANGGSFNYTVSVANTGMSPATFDAWIIVQLPSLTWYGPVLGPFNLTLPVSATLTRQRTQNVPGSAPAGSYTYRGYVGDYPSVKWDSSSFTFTKLGSGVLGQGASDWGNSGESFDAWMTTTQPVLPDAYSLQQNYPNPFNPVTVVGYQIPVASQVSLRVYDSAGRLVTTLVEGWREAGVHALTFEAGDLPSGVYLCKLSAGDFNAVQKMVLLK